MTSIGIISAVLLTDFTRVKVREGKIAEITEILAWYEYINDVILDHLDENIKSTDRSGVWRYLISFKVIKTVRILATLPV